MKQPDSFGHFRFFGIVPADDLEPVQIETWTARTTCKRSYEGANSWPYVWPSNFKQHEHFLDWCL